MTKDEFSDFIDEYNLYAFDGLILIAHENGLIHKGIWITSTPPLEKSSDGTFAGKDEYEIFYLLDIDHFVVWSVAEIRSVKCLEQNFLGHKPGQSTTKK